MLPGEYCEFCDGNLYQDSTRSLPCAQQLPDLQARQPLFRCCALWPPATHTLASAYVGCSDFYFKEII
jgi:hypothetical protein